MVKYLILFLAVLIMFLHLNNYTYIFAEENPKANVDNTEEIRRNQKTEEDTKKRI